MLSYPTARSIFFLPSYCYFALTSMLCPSSYENNAVCKKRHTSDTLINEQAGY